MKVTLLSRVRLLATPWTAAYQAPPTMGFSKQDYWSGLPLPSQQVELVLKNSPANEEDISESESCSVVYDSLQLHGLYSPWNSPGQNTGVGSLSLLLTQDSTPTQGLLHCM